jgi:hypothetical protein
MDSSIDQQYFDSTTLFFNSAAKIWDSYIDTMSRESFRFQSGKYIGVCPEEVLGLNGDRYLQWIATLSDYTDQELLDHVRERIVCDTEIQFGKYSGTRLGDLKKANPSYWKWLVNQAERDQRLSYINYV